MKLSQTRICNRVKRHNEYRRKQLSLTAAIIGFIPDLKKSVPASKTNEVANSGINALYVALNTLSARIPPSGHQSIKRYVLTVEKVEDRVLSSPITFIGHGL